MRVPNSFTLDPEIVSLSPAAVATFLLLKTFSGVWLRYARKFDVSLGEGYSQAHHARFGTLHSKNTDVLCVFCLLHDLAQNARFGMTPERNRTFVLYALILLLPIFLDQLTDVDSKDRIGLGPFEDPEKKFGVSIEELLHLFELDL